MAEMRIKTMKTLKRVLVLGLCLALLAGAALAEEMVNIGTDGYDCLYYKCSLPDGRMIFAGCQAKAGHYNDNHKARLVCVNPDGTVSWEYVDPEGICGMFCDTVVTEDGRICTIYEDSPEQETQAMSLKFFTLDGKPDGAAVPLDFDWVFHYALTPAGLFTDAFNYDKNRSEYIEFTAWNGKTLFRKNGGFPISYQMFGSGIIAEEDGLVLSGKEAPNDGSAAKIMKIDYQGNIVWENTLPLEMDMGSADLYGCKRTRDGGFVAWLTETAGSNYENARQAVVRFSADGRLVSKTDYNDEEEKAGKPIPSEMMTACGDQSVCQKDMIWEESSIDRTMVYGWYDAEGNELGTTEVQIRQADFPQFAKGREVEASHNELVAAGDTVWLPIFFWEECDSFEKTQASYEAYIIRVPMP